MCFIIIQKYLQQLVLSLQLYQFRRPEFLGLLRISWTGTVGSLAIGILWKSALGVSSDTSGEDDGSEVGDSDTVVSIEPGDEDMSIPDTPCPSEVFENDDEGVQDVEGGVRTDFIRVGPPKTCAHNCSHDGVEKESGPGKPTERSSWRKEWTGQRINRLMNDWS